MAKSKTTKKAPGRPANPEISELADKLAVTRQRASQLLKSGGKTSDIAKLRAEKLSLEIERLALEVERVKTGGHAEIGVSRKELRDALFLLKYAIETSLRGDAERIALDWETIPPSARFQRMSQLANQSVYAGIGAILNHRENELTRAISDILSEGDMCFRAGPSAEQHARAVGKSKNIS